MIEHIIFLILSPLIGWYIGKGILWIVAFYRVYKKWQRGEIDI